MFKRLSILAVGILFFIGMTTSSCNRSGCPGIDKKTGEFKKSKKSKTKSGLFPKDMR